MSEDTPQAGNEQEPGQTPQTGEQTPPESNGDDQTTFDLEYVRSLREEAKKYRLQLREQEEASKKHEEDRLTEQEEWKTLAEKRGKELETLKAQAVEREEALKQSAIRTAAIAEAAKRGFADPEDAYLLADMSGVEIDESGAITGLGDVIEALAKAKPHLIGGEPSGRKTFNPTNPGGKSALSLGDIKNMTPAEINANWDVVQETLKEKK